MVFYSLFRVALRFQDRLRIQSFSPDHLLTFTHLSDDSRVKYGKTLASLVVFLTRLARHQGVPQMAPECQTKCNTFMDHPTSGSLFVFLMDFLKTQTSVAVLAHFVKLKSLQLNDTGRVSFLATHKTEKTLVHIIYISRLVVFKALTRQQPVTEEEKLGYLSIVRKK